MRILAEYIWIDSNNDLRSKTKTINIPSGKKKKNQEVLSLLPEWNFDGSSTGQASTEKSDIILKPRAVFKDPFRLDEHKLDNYFLCDNILVLCDCYDSEDKPIKSNHRYEAATIFDNQNVINEKPWYGLEQEYVLINRKNNKILGWPETGWPEKQGKYYCSVGSDRAFGRPIVDEHYNKCIIAGLSISGINAEVLPGQWEFQIGPVEGIGAADQLWIARYILIRVCEKYDVIASFDPKPIKESEWNGSGCHCNFSTLQIRNDSGLELILQAIEKLKQKHLEHLNVYGDNSLRLTGKCETSSYDNFTYGISDRSASVRIPKNGTYFEDRRPASSCDPYLVTSIIAKTILL